MPQTQTMSIEELFVRLEALDEKLFRKGSTLWWKSRDLEGLELFLLNLHLEVISNYQLEITGERDAYFTIGLASAYRRMVGLRLKNLIKKQIYMRQGSQTPYLLDYSPERINTSQKTNTNNTQVACNRSTYSTTAKAMSPAEHGLTCRESCDMSAEDQLLAKEARHLLRTVEAEIESAMHEIKCTAPEGDKLFEIIDFYLHHCPNDAVKSTEMKMLCEHLGIPTTTAGRKKASGLKFKAKDQLLRSNLTKFASLHVDHIFKRKQTKSTIKAPTVNAFLDIYDTRKEEKKEKIKAKAKTIISSISQLSTNGLEKLKKEVQMSTASGMKKRVKGCYGLSSCPGGKHCPCEVYKEGIQGRGPGKAVLSAVNNRPKRNK